MKICVGFSDRLLGRALVDLLRVRGHDVDTPSAGEPDCALWIGSGGAGAPPPTGHARLLLQRGVEPPADEEPRAALVSALASGGQAVWRAPLDTGLLLEVLEERDRGEATRRQARAGGAPDLADAPHAWLVLDAQAGRIRAASDLARSLLDLPEDPSGIPVGNLPLPGRLRELLHDDSEGLRSEEICGRGHLAAWWTDRSGSRVLCLLEALPLNTPAARDRQWLAELGKTAATLAHEIRNPVASVAGALDLLESESDPEDRAEVLALARERLRQMARLLDKTLSLSRPITDPPESVDMRAALDSALSNLSLNPLLENIHIEFDMPEEPVVVRAFGAPLVQALTNLLLNAAQAQEGKGVIRLAVTADARRAILRIHDEGPGVPAEKREEIFKPFYTTRTAGTGLGLAEVRRAVGAMAGAVALDDVAEGACFRLELPLASTGADT